MHKNALKQRQLFGKVGRQANDAGDADRPVRSGVDEGRLEAGSPPVTPDTCMLSRLDRPRGVTTSRPNPQPTGDLRRDPGLIAAGLASRPPITIYWDGMPQMMPACSPAGHLDLDRPAGTARASCPASPCA